MSGLKHGMKHFLLRMKHGLHPTGKLQEHGFVVPAGPEIQYSRNTSRILYRLLAVLIDGVCSKHGLGRWVIFGVIDLSHHFLLLLKYPRLHMPNYVRCLLHSDA